MADRDGPIRIDQSDGRLCLIRCRRPDRQLYAPAATGRLAPVRCTIGPAARPRLRPDAENFGGEVSSRSLPLWSLYSITSSARASSVAGTVRPRTFEVVRLTTSSNLVGCSTGRSAGFAPRAILSTYSADRRNMSGKLGP